MIEVTARAADYSVWGLRTEWDGCVGGWVNAMAMSRVVGNGQQVMQEVKSRGPSVLTP